MYYSPFTSIKTSKYLSYGEIIIAKHKNKSQYRNILFNKKISNPKIKYYF